MKQAIDAYFSPLIICRPREEGWNHEDNTRPLFGMGVFLFNFIQHPAE